MWLQVKLEQLAVPEKGAIKIGPFGSQLKKSELVSSGIHVIGIENVLTGCFDELGDRYITEQKFKTLKSVEVKPGDVLITMMGTIGGVSIVPNRISPSIMDSHLLRIRPNPEICTPEYLAWLIKGSASTKKAIHGNAHGAIMKGLNSKIVRNLPAPLPPLSEQQRIVEILDQANALRKKRAEADAKAARILPALFYKMFGDPGTNPKGLVKRKLGDLIRVRSGNFLPAKNMNPAGHYPVYGGNGINGYHSEFMFEEHVIVLGRVGIYCGVVHYSEPNCWVTDNALYVAEQSKDLHPRYLVEALRVANLNQYAGRAGQPLISGNRIYPIEILVPPPEEQEKFASNIVHLHKHENRRLDAGDHIEKLFSVILHRAFTGDLTAKWRKTGIEKLLAEKEQQVKALKI